MSVIAAAAALMPAKLRSAALTSKLLPEGYVLWHSPSLCGCTLALDADWTPGSVAGKMSFRHPVPYTIRDIQIVTACAAHRFARTEALPDDPYFGSPGYLRLTTQRPLPLSESDRLLAFQGLPPADTVPLLDPREATAAQRLYIHLFRYTGGKHRPDTCECTQYWWGDRSRPDFVGYALHPIHTEKCARHAHLKTAQELARAIQGEQAAA